MLKSVKKYFPQKKKINYKQKKFWNWNWNGIGIEIGELELKSSLEKAHDWDSKPRTFQENTQAPKKDPDDTIGHFVLFGNFTVLKKVKVI